MFAIVYQVMFFVMAFFLAVIFIAIGIAFCQSLGRTADMIRHPEEWRDAGSTGERIVYNTLIKELGIPENQIFRNVYVPTGSGRTSEIDLVVMSRKGLFVFECKNYGGNIYGDAKRQKWIQYMGKKKSYFYSPLLQNKNHAKYLRVFLSKNQIDVPIVPVVTTISRGKWKIRNLSHDDYILGYNCHFRDIYGKMPESSIMIKNFTAITRILAPLSRPDVAVRKKHVEDLQR